MPKHGAATYNDRLNRIKGQISGVQNMIEAEEDVQKILNQIAAIISSLESTKIELIKDEVKESILKNIDTALTLIKR